MIRAIVEKFAQIGYTHYIVALVVLADLTLSKNCCYTYVQWWILGETNEAVASGQFPVFYIKNSRFLFRIGILFFWFAGMIFKQEIGNLYTNLLFDFDFKCLIKIPMLYFSTEIFKISLLGK